ncbi:MAG: hypothetical protein RLY58_2390 [Pseudomonadota bacterium]
MNAYRNAIRDQIEFLRRQKQSKQFLLWQIGADEAEDATLVSLRAYGTREHADVVMVACGVSGIWEVLPEVEVVLPTLLQIRQLRQLHGMDG